MTEQTATTETTATQQPAPQQNATRDALNMESLKAEAGMVYRDKNAILGYVLWWFFGLIGGHRYYTGKIGSAIAMTIITVIGMFTLIPLLITGIWWIVDAFLLHKWIGDHNAMSQVKRVNYMQSKSNQ